MTLEQEHSADASILGESAKTDVDPDTIAIADIRRDPELNCRHAGVVKATAREYAEVMRGRGPGVFPAITIFVDSKGGSWLADGWTRCAAAELAGIDRLRCERHKGSRRDALLFAASANSSHGAKRTTKCKHRTVSLLLADPTWAKRSDEWIAKSAAVSAPLVAKIRRTLNILGDGSRETADGRLMNTSQIGKAAESDELIATKLTTQLERVIAQWPDNKHDALRALLTRWSDAIAPVEAAE